MRLKATFILFVLLLFGQTAGAADTLYTEKAAMDIYASQPERALQIIDSAVILGNMDPLRADLLRAFIFSRTNEEMNYDAAILIGEQLMRNDSVLASTDLQVGVRNRRRWRRRPLRLHQQRTAHRQWHWHPPGHRHAGAHPS